MNSFDYADIQIVVTMSDKKLNQVNVIQAVVEKRMRRRNAARRIAIT